MIVVVILGQLDLAMDPVPQKLVGGGILSITNKSGLAFLYEHFNFCSGPRSVSWIYTD